MKKIITINHVEYVAHPDIDPIGYRGTREQWAEYLREFDNWYQEYLSEYIQSDETAEPMCMHDWITSMMDTHLRKAEQDDFDLPSLGDE